MWLCGWSAMCGQITFHVCDGCRDMPQRTWGQWLSTYLQTLLLWPLEAAVLAYINNNYKKSKSRGNKT